MNREQTDGCQRGGVGGLGEKVKGLKSSVWWLQNSHGDVKHSIGNTVNKTVNTQLCPGNVRGTLCRVS